jgi:CRISPR/Cas system CSM-associated protein Csm3 (group 7 of RAMP superfamily)
MWDENRYYESIRLVTKRTTDVAEERGHQQYTADRYTGQIDGTFTALQPLHVGTGLYVPPAQVGIESDVPLVKSFHSVDGRLTIPGSSLKGPIRSIVEAITYACVSKTGYRWQRHERDQYEECRYRSQQRQGNLCIACQMFGAMGYEGQIHFADAPQVAGETGVHFIPAQHQPKGSMERRHYPHALQDPNDPQWPLEAALPNSQFHLIVRFQNLTAGELGLLLIALGQDKPPLCLKLGAGKNSGLGAVRFGELQVERLNTEALYDAYDSSPAREPVKVAVCLKAAKKLLRTDDALTRLQADLGCTYFDKNK